MESIEKHIEVDQGILQNPTTSPQQRRHIEGELEELTVYQENHKEEIAAGDHHDPSYLELFCDANPSEPECLVYDDWARVAFVKRNLQVSVPSHRPSQDTAYRQTVQRHGS